MVAAPVILIPVTDEAPVLERVPIVLPLILIRVDVLEQTKPVTEPPVPVEVRFVMVLPDTVTDVAALEVEPMVTPVIFPWPVILVMVLLDKLETPFQ